MIKISVKNFLTILSSIFFILFGYFNTAYAANSFGGFPTSFIDVITNVLTFVFGAAGVIFVVLFVIGGIMYLTSAGNEEAATKAKKLLIDAVIGMIIIVSAWAAADWILKGIGGTAVFS